MNRLDMKEKRHRNMIFTTELSSEMDIEEVCRHFITQQNYVLSEEQRILNAANTIDLEALYEKDDEDSVDCSLCLRVLEDGLFFELKKSVMYLPNEFYLNPFPYLKDEEKRINGLFKHYKEAEGCEKYDEVFKNIHKPSSDSFETELCHQNLPFEKLPKLELEQKNLINSFLEQVTFDSAAKKASLQKLSKDEIKQAHKLLESIEIPKVFDNFLMKDDYNVQIDFPRNEFHFYNRTILSQELFKLVSGKSTPFEDLILCGIKIEDYEFEFDKTLFRKFKGKKLAIKITELQKEGKILANQLKKITKKLSSETEINIDAINNNIKNQISNDGPEKECPPEPNRFADSNTIENQTPHGLELETTPNEEQRLRKEIKKIRRKIGKLKRKYNQKKLETFARNTFYIRIELVRCMGEFNLYNVQQQESMIRPLKISRNPIAIRKSVLDRLVDEFLQNTDKHAVYETFCKYLFCPDFDQSTAKLFLWLRSNNIYIPDYLLDYFTGCVIENPVFTGKHFFDEDTLKEFRQDRPAKFTQNKFCRAMFPSSGHVNQEVLSLDENEQKESEVKGESKNDFSSSDTSAIDDDSSSSKHDNSNKTKMQMLSHDVTGAWWDPIEQKHFPKKVSKSSQKELKHFLKVRRKVKRFLGRFYKFLNTPYPKYDPPSNINSGR